MDQREPFARIVEGEGDVWVCVGQQIVNQFAQGEGLVFANNLVRALNAAHEARVKEEVRKAVEEFRDRAAKSIENEWINGNNGLTRSIEIAEEFGKRAAKRIRALSIGAESKS